MNGEFTGICNYYYELTQLLIKKKKRLCKLLVNYWPYAGETKLSEIDALVKYIRRVQKVKKDFDTLNDARIKMERDILTLMRHFEIPPNTKLSGVIEDEMEYKIWVDENDTIYIEKTKDLVPPPPGVYGDYIIYRIKTNDDDNEEEDDEEDED